MESDWRRVREEFPALENWTFLNTATFGQLPKRAAAAVARHFDRRDALACSDFLAWFDDADEIRQQAARLIHCDAGDIAFVPNAATALSLLLGGIDWKPGDQVVTFEYQFPNKNYIPARLAQNGVDFIETSWEDFAGALTERTRLVILSSVNYTNGFRPPLEKIRELSSRAGALLYVDVTQSLGALQFDCRAVRPDMVAVHAYKWLLSPNGAGFMYVSPEVRRWLRPNVIGWRSHHDWRNVDNLHHSAPDFKDTAEKYEGGMLNFAGLYAMSASLGLMLELGPEVIEARVLALAEQVRKAVRDLGAELPGDVSPHFVSPIVAAKFPGCDPSRLAGALRQNRVLVSARHGKLRISTHFYNNDGDVDRFASELRRLL
jgi:selenocysteine lyase/cysteine desulfurase